MNKETITKAFDEFEKGKYTDSEDTLRGEIKQAVNDHLKGKLGLKKDPIVSPSAAEEE